VRCAGRPLTEPGSLPVNFHQQPRIYELVGKSASSGWERRLQLDRARGGVDLVVEGEDLSRRDPLLLCPIERVHGESVAEAGCCWISGRKSSAMLNTTVMAAAG